MKILNLILPLGAAIMLLSSCSHTDKWSVSGNITDADGKLLTLERSFNNRWTVIDSVRLDSKGKYRFTNEPAGYPDIYRLTLDNGASAYFPIDSLDNITLNADAANFATGYTLEGSASAESLTNVNNIINAKVAELGRAAVGDSLLKRQLSEYILNDMGSVVSYYLINKEISGQPLFNPANRTDLRVIGAVVNAYSVLRPNDPRTRVMEQSFIAWRRASNPVTNQVQAMEIGFPEISLKGVDGKDHDLSDLAGNGRPVILNFTAYAAENSPAINIALANIYNAGGVDIYQVSIDADEYTWREAARNLPWTAVLMSPRDGDRVLREYNVGGIPTSFIIDKDGRLQERVEDTAKLAQLIKKYK